MPQPNRRVRDREILTLLRQLVDAGQLGASDFDTEFAVVDRLPDDVAKAVDAARAKTLAGKSTMLLLFEHRGKGQARLHAIYDVTQEFADAMKLAEPGDADGDRD